MSGPRELRTWVERWITIVRRGAIWIVVAFALIDLVLAAYIARSIAISTDTMDMLSPTLEWRQHRDAYLEAFPQEDESLIVVIDAPTPEAAEMARDRLAERLERRDDLFRELYRPGGGPYFERTGLLFLDPQELEQFGTRLTAAQPLFGRLAARPTVANLLETMALAEESIPDSETLAELNEELAEAFAAMGREGTHWISWRSLVRPDDAGAEPRAFLSARVNLDTGAVPPGRDAIEAVRDAGDDLGFADSEVRVRLTGQVALRHDEFQSLKSDARVIAIASIVLVGSVLYVGLRSRWLVTASLLTLISGLIATGAFATAAVGELNMISVAFAALYVGLGIDYPIHLGLRYQELVRTGLDRFAALSEAMRSVGPSLWLCAVTTALGFFAFIPTKFTGVAQLGLIAGVGMFISLIVSTTLFPALLALVPIGTRNVNGSMTTRLPRAIAFESRRHPTAVLIGTGAFALIAAGLATQVRFDANRMNLRASDTESMQTLEELETSPTASPQMISVLTDSVGRAERLATRLEGLETVRSTRTLVDFVPKNQEPKLAILDDLLIATGPLPRMPAEPARDDPEATLDAMRELLAALEVPGEGEPDPSRARLRRELSEAIRRLERADPERRADMVAELRRSVMTTLPTLIERLNTSLQAAPVSRDDLPRALVERWRSGVENGVWRVEVRPEGDIDDEAELRRFVRSVRAIAPGATGPPVVTLAAGDAVVAAFRTALIIAALAIGAVLLAVLRSVREALIVGGGIGFAGVATVASSVVLSVPFNFANVISLPLILGFGVDSAIHVVHRARALRGSGDRLVSTSTARGVLFSSLTTIAGFAGLILSDHPGTKSLGILLIPGVLFSMIAALVVIPPMIAPIRGSTGRGDRA